MPALNEISGIGISSLELLEAAGIRDAEHLARQNPEHLLEEIQKANDTLSISKRTPGIAAVEKWITGAIELVGVPEEEPEIEATPVNYEGNEEVAAMLADAPFAIPLPGKVMMEKQLRVSDVPAGILLNRYSGDLDVRVESQQSNRSEMPARRESKGTDRFQPRLESREVDPSNIRSSDSQPKASPRMLKSKDSDTEDRVALIRAPREKTNRGKDPNSRNYVRGVLHTHPWSLRVGAVFSILLLIVMPLAIISAFLLLVSREYPESFYWVPKWILAFPIALPVVGLGYLFWGFSGKCRICTQKLFVHKGALKHVKAHRLPGMGYVVPLCIHLLLFNWFRCSSCGTPVRLRK